MTSTGGLVPQANSVFSCSHCGLMFESSTSLQVHMHYQHENQSRWGSSPNSVVATSSTTPADPENNNNNNNNNQPIGKHHIKAMSPHHHQNTIAAADSSDNNPPTPQPNEHSDTPQQQNSFQSNGTNSPFPHNAPPATNDLHHSYPSYPSYEGLYYHNMDYHQQEYKQAVPSTSRYNSNNSNSTSINSSVQIANNSNGLSPRIVSSSSPTHNPSTTQNTNVHIMHISPGQPTPSPSPKQCDKCGVVCETDGQLIEHSQVAHSDLNGIKNGENGEQQQQNYPPFPSSAVPPIPPPPSHHHNHYVKEEPASDILDLDSQKMVYPPHPDGALPPMHSLHPLQSIQRHPMIWGHHDATAAHFIPPHPGSYHHHHQTIKPEYPPTPPMNAASMKAQINEYSPILPPTPVSMKQEYNHIKSEYNSSPNMAQNNSLPPAASINSKGFNSDMSESGSLTTTSPSDFPSTTTPQENGGQYQRSFEPPSSSLPVKSTSWKSNEARRPKTYNCTACNKWFTSSGHLKRHYNTTLHKNAVKSSGQPDPATLPISAHHHPNRDPNYIPKRRSHHQRNQVNQQAQQSQNQTGNQVTTSTSQTQLQPTISSDSSARSPDYQPQFSLPSFGTTALQQGFQQYGSSNLHSASGNGQAGEITDLIVRNYYQRKSVQNWRDSEFSLEFMKFLK